MQVSVYDSVRCALMGTGKPTYIETDITSNVILAIASHIDQTYNVLYIPNSKPKWQAP